VFGYGRGHATRALSVLPELMDRHETTVLAGGDAYDTLAPHFPVTRVPTLRYEYAANGKHWLSRTLSENVKHITDILFSGPGFREVRRQMSELRPDVVISDAEPWTHTAAARLRIPRISFDHYGVLAYCRPRIPWGDRLRSCRDVWAYRWLMGRPDRIIVSSFYEGERHDARIRFVGPLLRPEVLARRSTDGQHLLVYLNRGGWQLTPRIEAGLRSLGVPVVVYGTARVGEDGPLSFRPASNEGFLDDLASCRAVFSTAGNQLVGEAQWFGKPMLVTPENTVEQRLNAASVLRLGIGEAIDHDCVEGSTLRAFFGRVSGYRRANLPAVRDGRAAAIAAIEGFARELRVSRARAQQRAWTYA
jgi:uncharacterized protein (TIGR00661 family)